MENNQLKDEIIGYLLRKLIVDRSRVKDFVEESGFEGDWFDVHKIMETVAASASAAIETCKATPTPLEKVELFAYLGEDEHGSGVIGLKQAFVAAGCIPMVATIEEKMNREDIIEQMQRLSDAYAKTITLCRYKYDSVVLKIVPATPPLKPST